MSIHMLYKWLILIYCRFPKEPLAEGNSSLLTSLDTNDNAIILITFEHEQKQIVNQNQRHSPKTADPGTSLWGAGMWDQSVRQSESLCQWSELGEKGPWKVCHPGLSPTLESIAQIPSHAPRLNLSRELTNPIQQSSSEERDSWDARETIERLK